MSNEAAKERRKLDVEIEQTKAVVEKKRLQAQKEEAIKVTLQEQNRWVVVCRLETGRLNMSPCWPFTFEGSSTARFVTSSTALWARCRTIFLLTITIIRSALMR